MKKVWILAVVMAFVLALAACGGNGTPAPAPPAPPAPAVDIPPVEAPPVYEPAVYDIDVNYYEPDYDAYDAYDYDDEPAYDEYYSDGFYADEQPVDDEPADDEPADEPVADEPADDEPADEPVADTPAPTVALPAGTQYNLGAFTAPHNWAPGWSTDGRNDNSYPLQMETLQAASHLVIEFSGNPETVIEFTLMSEGNGWSWTQVPVWNSDYVDWDSVLAAGNYVAVIDLGGVEGWSDFVSAGPAHLGVGGLGGNDAVTVGTYLILN